MQKEVGTNKESNDKLSRAFDSSYHCRKVLTYFPWLLVGASPADLSPEIALPLVRHAKRCPDCERWIISELHVQSAAEFEKFLIWSWNRRRRQRKPEILEVKP
jgi:hypothetical protein